MALYDILLAKQLAGSGGGGGGGNPNTVQTITGTLANPWGDVDPDELGAKLESLDASANITIDASALGAGEINSRMNGNSVSVYTNGASIPSDSASDATAYVVSWLHGSLTIAKMLSGGNIVNISPYASMLTTSITIIWHPLPADEIPPQ